MRICRIVLLALLMALSSPVWAQQTGQGVEVDYNNPKKYIVGGVKVEGNQYFSSRYS